MAGDQTFYGNTVQVSRDQNANEQAAQKAILPFNSQPMAEKKGAEIQTTTVGYKVIYKGPASDKDEVYSSSGRNCTVNVTLGGKDYSGNANVKLTKIQGDNNHVGFSITLSLPDLDSNPMVWSTSSSQPASIKIGLITSTITADRLDTSNNTFNSQLSDGQTLVISMFSGIGNLSFYRIPGTTDVMESVPVKSQGMTVSASTSSNNLKMEVNAPAGTPLDINLYNSLGQKVQMFGKWETDQKDWKQEFSLEPSLPSGQYFAVVESPQGTASIPVMIVK